MKWIINFVAVVCVAFFVISYVNNELTALSDEQVKALNKK